MMRPSVTDPSFDQSFSTTPTLSLGMTRTVSHQNKPARTRDPTASRIAKRATSGSSTAAKGVNTLHL